MPSLISVDIDKARSRYTRSDQTHSHPWLFHRFPPSVDPDVKNDDLNRNNDHQGNRFISPFPWSLHCQSTRSGMKGDLTNIRVLLRLLKLPSGLVSLCLVIIVSKSARNTTNIGSYQIISTCEHDTIPYTMKLSTSLFALLSALPVIIAYDPPKLKVALTVSMITDWDHGDVAWLDGNDPKPKAFKITSPPPPRETTYIGDLHYTQLGVGYPILITREKGIYTVGHQTLERVVGH
jgi:hypothetical protein